MTAVPLDVRVAGRRIDAVELPGDPALAPIVLLHEGLGSIDLWRDFPAAVHAMTGRRTIVYSRFGHGRSALPPRERTPAFFHEEALEVLPSLLAQIGAHQPLLVGHSDGASIALIHAGHAPTAGVVLMAPHVFVEDVTLTSIEAARRRYVDGDLRARMERHHDDVDAAFWGWCGVWLDPAFRDWDLNDDVARLAAPALLIQGVADPYGTMAQLDRIEALAPGSVQRRHVAGGHNPQFEATGDTLDAIAAFVAAPA